MRGHILTLSFLLMAPAAMAQGKNLLFYGNSYTYYSWGYGVPEVVRMIATQAGQPTPNLVIKTIGGSTLLTHATDPGQVGAISTSLPAGETWDYVVMQASSEEATEHFGFSSAAFFANSVQIVGNVRAHSPAAKAVMYQTWAKAWGHMYFPVPWATPMEQHDEIRGNYQQSVVNIDATFGPGTATNAAVGDGVALLEWDPAWYESDRSHPSPSMILLAAMTIYTSIYGQPACEIDPGFGSSSALAQALLAKNVTEPTWDLLAGLADRSAHPSNRRYPGSGDHLLLESATGSAPVTACPTRSVTAGTQLSLQLRSMNGVFDAGLALLLFDFMLTGSPPTPLPAFPEIRVDLLGAIIGPIVPLATPVSVSLPMPLTLPGGSFLVQGLALQASGETGNPSFTATDAHELVMF